MVVGDEWVAGVESEMSGARCSLRGSPL
ncbi:hypothetical protein A2U01_0067131, partial [Trifolium medium]|nr:hypothetical protein [Trifolium medium]